MINTTDFHASANTWKAYSDIMDMIADDVNGKEVVYISGPATGVYNYIENFKYMESYLKNKYPFMYILNPMRLIDKAREGYELSYIDGVFITLELVKFSTFLVLDDRTDKWMNSRGVLIELCHCVEHGKEIISFKKMIEGDSLYD